MKQETLNKWCRVVFLPPGFTNTCSSLLPFIESGFKIHIKLSLPL